MPLLEIELTAQRFGEFVQMLASAGPIPVPTIDALGPDRLITRFDWGAVTVGAEPTGHPPSVGTLSARASVTVWHISIDELEANASAVPVSVVVDAWLVVSAHLNEMRVDMIGIGLSGTSPQFFYAPHRVGRRVISQISGQINVASAAVVVADSIVTVRFSNVGANATLFAVPKNFLKARPTDDWLIRIEPDFFVDQLLTRLETSTQPPPAGTELERTPTAQWVNDAGGSGVIGGFGIVKPNACPGLFGAVDVSVDITTRLSLVPNLSSAPPTLGLTLTLESDASDWDAFRCWLGSLGFGSGVLTYIAPAYIGITGAIASLFFIANKFRVDAGSKLSEQKFQNLQLDPTRTTSTSATYVGTQALPALDPAQVTSATVGINGLVTTGNIRFGVARHSVQFNPDGGSLAASISRGFSCQSRGWVYGASVQQVMVTDSSTVGPVSFGNQDVVLFGSSTSRPAGHWKIDGAGSVGGTLAVTIEGNSAVMPGDTARLYIHTSAGLRRYTLGPLTALTPLTNEQEIAIFTHELNKCLRLTKQFNALEEIKWLVDPPDFHYGLPAIRQWQIVFTNIPVGTTVTIHQQRADGRDQPVVYVADHTGDAVIELTTDGATELTCENDSEGGLMGRVNQRWILPLQLLPLGGPATVINRDGGAIIAETPSTVVRWDTLTGAIDRTIEDANSRAMTSRNSLGLLATTGATTGHPCSKKMAAGATPPRQLGISLPRGRVAVPFAENLVIGLPWPTRLLNPQPIPPGPPGKDQARRLA